MKLLLVSLLWPSLLFAQCFPQNSEWYPVTSRSGITKAQFQKAVTLVEKYYQPIVEAQNKELKINQLWSDGTVNAQAYRIGKVWFVDAFGGLARYPGMKYDGFLLVMCHEVGHHLGGSPRYDRNTDWASVEGQADYWATVACMREVAPNIILGGSVTLAKVLASLSGEPIPDIATPDQTVRAEVYESHPPAQCRLDTYLAGKDQKARPRCWYAP